MNSTNKIESFKSHNSRAGKLKITDADKPRLMAKVTYYYVVCGYTCEKISRTTRIGEVRVRKWLEEEGLYKPRHISTRKPKTT